MGVRDGAEAGADLAALGGLGLTGPGAPGVARALLAALLAAGLPGQPARPAQVIIAAADAAVLFPGAQVAGTIAGLTVTATTEEALGQAEEVLLRLARTSGTDELTGQPPGQRVGQAQPALVLITNPPPGGQRLAALLDAGRHAGLAAIVLGAWPHGATCHVTADGQATCADPALDGIQLFHLDSGSAAAITHLLGQAHGTATGNQAHPAPVSGGPPAPWAHDAHTPSPAGHASPPSAPAARETDTSWPPGQGTPTGAAGSPPARHPRRPPAAFGHHQPSQRSQPERPIRVEILGPVRITAAGRELQGGLRKARELATCTPTGPAGRPSAKPCGPARRPATAPASAASRCANSAACSAPPPA